MDIDTSNDFIQTLALLYKFCAICAIPTVVIRKGRVQLSKFRLFYCICLIALFYASFWFSCKTITGAILASGFGDVSSVVGVITLFLGVFYISICVMVNLLLYKRRTNLILDMIAMHRDLEYFCGQRSESRYRNVARVSICTAISKFFLQTGTYLYFAGSTIEFNFLKLGAPFFCSFFEIVWIETTFIEICVYLYIFKNELVCLNSTLRNVLKSKNNVPLGSESILKILYQLKSIHKKISKVTEDMNKCFGMIIAGQISIMFIEITTALYNNYKLGPNCMNDYCIMNSVIKGVCLCSLSDSVIEQIKAAGREIYKIDTGIYKISLLNEIELVSLQAISYQNRFTATNFFNIDNRLLLG
nr:unnamed protein product [Callosobruchus chinensis]